MNLQSPCGYMYEPDGPDLGYTLNTHHENLQMAYHYWRGTHLGDFLSKKRIASANGSRTISCPRPGQPFWVANRSIESRQQHAIFPAVDTPLADHASSCAPLPRRRSGAPSRSRPPAKNWNDRLATG